MASRPSRLFAVAGTICALAAAGCGSSSSSSSAGSGAGAASFKAGQSCTPSRQKAYEAQQLMCMSGHLMSSSGMTPGRTTPGS